MWVDEPEVPLPNVPSERRLIVKFNTVPVTSRVHRGPIARWRPLSSAIWVVGRVTELETTFLYTAFLYVLIGSYWNLWPRVAPTLPVGGDFS